MRLPFLSRRVPGWLAVCPSEGGIDLIHVTAGARPGVRLLASAGQDGDIAGPLGNWRKQLGLADYRCVSLLRSGEYQLQQIDAPAVPRAEWKDALRWKLKDVLDFPAEEAVFDVLDIPTEQYAPSRPRNAFLVTARRPALAARVAPFDAAGLQLSVLDIPETAQRNIAALFEDENRGIACIAFDEAGALLTVTFRGELYASRRIEVAPAQFASADSDRRAQLFERVALEAQRTLDAFDRQYSFMTVSKLLVAKRPELAGIEDVLAGSLYIPLETMDLSRVLDFEAGSELADPVRQARCLHAIGAALRSGDGE